MEGIALSELRHLLEETSQHHFTADLHEGKYYPVLKDVGSKPGLDEMVKRTFVPTPGSEKLSLILE